MSEYSRTIQWFHKDPSSLQLMPVRPASRYFINLFICLFLFIYFFPRLIFPSFLFVTFSYTHLEYMPHRDVAAPIWTLASSLWGTPQPLGSARSMKGKRGRTRREAERRVGKRDRRLMCIQPMGN